MNWFRNKPSSAHHIVAVRRLASCAGVLLLLGLVFIAGAAPVALAQGAQPPPTPTPTPPAAATVITRAAPVANSTHLLILVIATLLFTILALAAVFRYMYSIQSRYYDLVGKLGRLGQTVKTTIVQAFDTTGIGYESGGEDTGAKQVTLEASGPGVVEIGQEAEFTAKLSDGTTTDAAAWSVEPKTAAAIRPSKPESTASVKVIPAVAGAFTLNVEVTALALKTSLNVAAVAPSGGGVEVPFVGRGYGSIAIAIVIVAAVIILGLSGVLGAESVGALLAALLGYIFGVTAAGRGSKSEGEE
jgi:hypothetical protein